MRANGAGTTAAATTTMGGMTGWSLQNLTNAVAWIALGVGVATAIAFVITSGIVFSRETRRYERLNIRTRDLQNQLGLCYCETFFFDDIFTIRNQDDPSKTFQFSAANISAEANRTYTMPDSDGTLALETVVADDDGFYAELTVVQSIPPASPQTVVFDDDFTGLGNDPEGNYDNTTGIYTTPTDGFYDISYHLQWVAGATTAQFLGQVQIISPSRSTSFIRLLDIMPTTGVLLQPTNGGTMLHADLRSGDTVVVECFQTTGGNVDLNPNSLFSVTRTG